MVLAVRQWDLQLFGCQSLKDKRGRLSMLKAALRQLNVSVAETGHRDLWQRAELACGAVGSDRRVVEEILREADRIVERADGIRVIDTMVSYL
ncbi:MAG: DUF503 domain-containing protein [Gemmatimonadales bacterium]